MASRFHHRSIREKFSLVIISACLIVLLLVSLLFVAIEYTSFRQNSALEIKTLASILGTQLSQPLLNSAKSFNPEAKNVLAALNTNTHLHAAYLFDRNNKPISHYLDADAIPFVEKNIKRDFPGEFPEQWLHLEESRLSLGLNSLSIYAPIFFQGQRIGGLYLISDLGDLWLRIFGLLLVVLPVGGIAVSFAWFISGWLQKPISDPILQLAETMSRVTATCAYSLRSPKYAEDEVGQLVDGFNNMLSQIEMRDLKIETHQKYLEQTVIERTEDLTSSIRDLVLAREQAEFANQAKSIFLANMTHELRTPLVGVLGMNELLIESRLDSQQRSLAETVQSSGRDLLGLIKDILDFSKIEAGHLKLEMGKFDLLRLVEETVSLLADRAYGKGLELICSVEPAAAWEVEADSLRLKQIIVNLLGNAIKFTHQGHVGLKLTRLEDGHFLLEVYDTGIGVDQQSQSSIFEAFSQVDESTSRLFGGTGLGLSIVRDLTRMMDGSIHLVSETGQGASFQVDLPLKPVRPSFERLAEKNLGRSVVLLEPCPQARDSLLQRLLDLGFTAQAVSSPEELMLLLENAERGEVRFDLVILPDCDNGIGGRELLAQAAGYCDTVICQQNKFVAWAQNSLAVQSPKPLLWARLLQDDLFEIKPNESLPVTVIAEVKLPGLPVRDIISKGRILIVDDNSSTRELIGFSLVGSNWQSDEACNAEQALAAVASEQYRLILMDINMPGTDGLEVTRILRRRGVEVPIFALTAHGDAKVFDQCEQAGMQGSLRKPFRQKELFTLLERYSAASSENLDIL